MEERGCGRRAVPAKGAEVVKVPVNGDLLAYDAVVPFDVLLDHVRRCAGFDKEGIEQAVCAEPYAVPQAPGPWPAPGLRPRCRVHRPASAMPGRQDAPLHHMLHRRRCRRPEGLLGNDGCPRCREADAKDALLHFPIHLISAQGRALFHRRPRGRLPLARR
jgi:hypothetical protein